MTSGEFHQHLGRLSEQYGKAAYSQARAELIWREVKDFSPFWWEKTVDHLLITCRQAPLHAEFGELIGRERERLWRIEKDKNAKDAKDFFSGTYQPDDVKTICQMIKMRLQQKVGDEEYSSFVQHLDHAAKSNPQLLQMRKCRACDDSGLRFERDQNNYEWTYRCTCESGMKKPKSYPIYQPTYTTKGATNG